MLSANAVSITYLEQILIATTASKQGCTDRASWGLGRCSVPYSSGLFPVLFLWKPSEHIFLYTPNAILLCFLESIFLL